MRSDSSKKNAGVPPVWNVRCRNESESVAAGRQDIVPGQDLGGPYGEIVYAHESTYQAAHRLGGRREFEPMI